MTPAKTVKLLAETGTWTSDASCWNMDLQCFTLQYGLNASCWNTDVGCFVLEHGLRAVFLVGGRSCSKFMASPVGQRTGSLFQNCQMSASTASTASIPLNSTGTDLEAR